MKRAKLTLNPFGMPTPTLRWEDGTPLGIPLGIEPMNGGMCIEDGNWWRSKWWRWPKWVWLNNNDSWVDRCPGWGCPVGGNGIPEFNGPNDDGNLLETFEPSAMTIIKTLLKWRCSYHVHRKSRWKDIKSLNQISL